MYRIVCLISATLLSACAQVEFAQGPQLLSQDIVSDKSYEIGVAQTAFVGNSMIRVRDYRVERFSGAEVRINESFTVNGFGFNRQFIDGETYRYGGRTSLNDEPMHFFLVGTYGILFDESGQVQHKILNLSTGTNVFLVYEYETTSTPGSVERVVSERQTATPDGQNFELVYSGRTSDAIRINYREFTDDNMARQAFYQELSYPADAEEIRFRDLVIQVDEVRADAITFTVMED